MGLFVFTQMTGGVGTTTVAANTTYMWPNRRRMLIELGITGGDLMQKMDLSITSAVSNDLIESGWDIGKDSDPIPLSKLHEDAWELPAILAPAIPGVPSPGQPTWWENRMTMATRSDMDIICDIGKVAPEHLIMHNQVLNVATVIVGVIGKLSDAKIVGERLAAYRDRLALLLVSPQKTLPQEVTDTTGVQCLGVLPRNPDIENRFWKNILVSDDRKSRDYHNGIASLAMKLGGN